jgi:hypothetical protein
MNISMRVVISFLVAAIVLFLGMLFWHFIVNNIIRPTALVLWLLLRILVLSVHQKYFWYAVIFVAFIVLFRFLPHEQSDIQSDAYLEPNTTIVNIGYWRSLFIYNGQSVRDEETLKRELTYLLTSLYASKQGISNNFGIHDALQQGRIPLPENIHTILFSQGPPVSGGLLKRFFQFIRETPRKWMRQWTGQEETEYYQMIEEVLHFVETSLEINNDDRKLLQNKH